MNLLRIFSSKSNVDRLTGLSLLHSYCIKAMSTGLRLLHGYCIKTMSTGLSLLRLFSSKSNVAIDRWTGLRLLHGYTVLKTMSTGCQIRVLLNDQLHIIVNKVSKCFGKKYTLNVVAMWSLTMSLSFSNIYQIVSLVYQHTYVHGMYFACVNLLSWIHCLFEI